MQVNKLFLTLCLLAMTTTASAQFANAGAGKSRKGGSVLVKETDPYNRIYVSYSPMNYVPDSPMILEGLKLTGFSVGYLRGINLSCDLPLFLEVGGNMAYSYGDFYNTVDYKLLSVNVPVNVAYKLTFGDSGFSLTPFLGLNFRYNILRKAESPLFDYLYDYDEDWFEDPGYYLYMGEWKRFQVGWQIGVGFNYKKLYVGVSYGSDFSEIAESVKARTPRISLGLNF